MTHLGESKYAIPVISAIIEKKIKGEPHILIQTRISDYDKEYHGTIEIPAGRIDSFESVYDTIKREVKEETGLDVIEIYPKPETRKYKTIRNDEAIAFETFCCQQIIKGNIPWIGFVFICKVREGDFIPEENHTKDHRWVSLEELESLITKEPDKIFTLQLPVLEKFLRERQKK